MPIFRSQLNKLITALLNDNFTEKGFELNEDLTNTALIVDLPLTITHKTTGFFFEIGSRTNGFQVKCLPGVNAAQSLLSLSQWTEVIRQSKTWMSRVVREMEQPDPWVLLNQGKILTEELPSIGEGLEKLSGEDFLRLEEFVRSLKEFILTETNPTEGQLKLIDETELPPRSNRRRDRTSKIGPTLRSE